MNSRQQQYVQFTLGEEKYAIHISEIHEIIKMQEISELPRVKPYIKGVINLRGKVVPVISLRNLFDLPKDEYTKYTRIVILKHNEETIGAIVDRVDRVTTFLDIQPPPQQFGGLSGAIFSGIGILEESIVGILRLDQILLKEDEEAENTPVVFE